jgi:hypothetical protein
MTARRLRHALFSIFTLVCLLTDPAWAGRFCIKGLQGQIVLPPCLVCFHPRILR